MYREEEHARMNGAGPGERPLLPKDNTRFWGRIISSDDFKSLYYFDNWLQ
jgi:hypothetical protein